MFGRSRVRVLARRLAIVIDVYRAFLRPTDKILGKYRKLEHEPFLPSLPIHYSLIIHAPYSELLTASVKKQQITEDGCVLGSCAMQSNRSISTFRRCLPLPSSGRLPWRAVCASNTSVYLYGTTRRNIPEYSHLRTCRHDSILKRERLYERVLSILLNAILGNKTGCRLIMKSQAKSDRPVWRKGTPPAGHVILQRLGLWSEFWHVRFPYYTRRLLCWSL